MQTTEAKVPPLLLAVLISLSVGGLMSSDINLPGLAQTAHALGTSVSAVQATFSPYLVGLLVAQLIYGPWSDAIGRRRLVIGGFTLYAVASLGCALSPNIAVFAGARLLQALGAGAGLVLARAIVGDLYGQQTAARVFTTIMPVVGASPAISPLMGGYLTTYLSWRAPFFLTALIALVTVLAVALRVPESLPAERRARRLRTTVGNYRRLLVSGKFWGYGLNLGVGYAVYTGYLVASPVIFQRLGMSTEINGYCYISIAAAYITGNLVSRRLVQRHSIDRLLVRGHLIFSSGALVLLAVGLTDPQTPWPLLVLMTAVTIGNGFLFPMSVAGGVTSFPAMAGAASGLLGAVQMAGGSFASLVVSKIPPDIRSFAILVAVLALTGLTAFHCLRAVTARSATEPEAPQAAPPAAPVASATPTDE
ncbi:multidrug effflux MFS transporter [Streptomyces endophytica]|uniref:Multidrug effflux MFS transporter n=1 Tax=Streptomyces endophytica TaxID=2991496 RepID=A0ABY6PIU6_9ACTN|nr:multidrug effflux MFS transporter [Streptomyces endophytica]UZJ33818.1 multidrug effflux MFS transporter [Streptomyces endophytica]